MIESCAFRGRGSESPYYAVSVQGVGASDAYVVRNRTFNTVDDLADTGGRGAGVQTLAVDSLVVENCVGYNAGNHSGTSLHQFVFLGGVSRATVRNLAFQLYLRDRDQSDPLNDANGIEIGSWGGNPSRDVLVESCGFWGVGHGIHVANDTARAHIRYVWCDSTYDDVVFVDDGATETTVEFVVSHFAQDDGIDIQGSDVLARNCTIVRPRNAGIQVSTISTDVTFLDNIVYDVRDPEARPDEMMVAYDDTGDQADHNLWFDPVDAQDRFYVMNFDLSFEQWQGLGQVPSGMYADPLFLNDGGRAWPVGNPDFALCQNSPGVFGGTDGGTIGALGIASCTTAVGEVVGTAKPLVFPNPVPLSARAEVVIEGMGHEAVSIFDAGGRLVRRLEPDVVVRWELCTHGGTLVAPGIYFVRWTSDRAAKIVVLE